MNLEDILNRSRTGLTASILEELGDIAGTGNAEREAARTALCSEEFTLLLLQAWRDNENDHRVNLIGVIMNAANRDRRFVPLLRHTMSDPDDAVSAVSIAAIVACEHQELFEEARAQALERVRCGSSEDHWFLDSLAAMASEEQLTEARAAITIWRNVKPATVKVKEAKGLWKEAWIGQEILLNRKLDLGGDALTDFASDWLNLR